MLSATASACFSLSQAAAVPVNSCTALDAALARLLGTALTLSSGFIMFYLFVCFCQASRCVSHVTGKALNA